MKRVKRSKKSGLPPGSVVYVGPDVDEAPPVLTQITFDAQHFDEHGSLKPSDIVPPTPDKVTWVNLEGVHDVDYVQQLGQLFKIHPLTMEDIVSTDQRPKRDTVGDYMFVVTKMLSQTGSGAVVCEQVSFILGAGYLLSFQERKHPGDVFNAVRERLRLGKGKLRQCGADYLLYALMDAIVDQYYLILENFGERVESLEAELVREPRQEMLAELYNLKRGALTLRRSAFPLREVVTSLLHEENHLFDKNTIFYLRDLYSHVIQIIDSVEVLRETIAGMLEIYLSSLSNKLNAIMKVLTLVTTIFMPLSLIAGIYGMNFSQMPELHWTYGYYFALGLMAAVAVLMLTYFRRRGWL